MIRRLIRLWWQLRAGMADPQALNLDALPEGWVPATTTAQELFAEADAAGVADARSGISDPWSFGAPGEARSDAYDPPYIRSLRSRREIARDGLRTRQRQAEARVANLRRRSADEERRVQGARAQMSELAAREAAVGALEFAAAGYGPGRMGAAPPRGAAPLDPDSPLPGATPTDPAPDPDLADPATAEAVAEPAPVQPDPLPGYEQVRWEGETMPLHAVWRLLILCGLTAAQLPVQYVVDDNLLGHSVSADLIRWMVAATSAVVVLGPFLAGATLRSSAGTGADRRIPHSVLAFTGSWLVAAVALGLIRGHVFQADASQSGTQRPSSVTVVVMFSALLLIVGVMAFMLGQARRHPYQEAYVRHRRNRERFETAAHMTAIDLNPAYRPPEPGQREPVLEAEEREIAGSYEAAEEAYFAALCRAKGNPAFTEAVQDSRARRSHE